MKNLLELLNASAPIVSAVAWPLVAIIAVWLFKRPVRDLLDRIKEGNFGGLSFSAEAAEKTKPSEQERQLGEQKVKKECIGNAYWLAHDLMRLHFLLLRNGNREGIVRHFVLSNWHLKQIGLGGSPVQVRLEKLCVEAEASLNSDWNPMRRMERAQEVQSLAGDIGRIVESSQRGFKGTPWAQ
jgi:hypothetical protein